MSPSLLSGLPGNLSPFQNKENSLKAKHSLKQAKKSFPLRIVVSRNVNSLSPVWGVRLYNMIERFGAELGLGNVLKKLLLQFSIKYFSSETSHPFRWVEQFCLTKFKEDIPILLLALKQITYDCSPGIRVFEISDPDFKKIKGEFYQVGSGSWQQHHTLYDYLLVVGVGRDVAEPDGGHAGHGEVERRDVHRVDRRSRRYLANISGRC